VISKGRQEGIFSLQKIKSVLFLYFLSDLILVPFLGEQTAGILRGPGIFFFTQIRFFPEFLLS